MSGSVQCGRPIASKIFVVGDPVNKDKKQDIDNCHYKSNTLLVYCFYRFFIIYYLLFIIYYLLFIIYYLLFIIYYLLFIIYY